MTNQESICHRAFSAMADDVESLSLVRECRELELRYNSTFTSAILCAKEKEKVNIIRNAQSNICKMDQSLLLQKSSTYPFLIQIAKCVGWKKLWDNALDHGPSVIKGLKNLVRVITYPNHSPKICPFCDIQNLDQPLIDHVISNHTNSDSSWSSLLDSLCAMDPNCFSHILCLSHLS